MESTCYSDLDTEYSIFSNIKPKLKKKNSAPVIQISQNKNSSIASRFNSVLVKCKKEKAFGTCQKRFLVPHSTQPGPGTYQHETIKYQYDYLNKHKYFVPFGTKSNRDALSNIHNMKIGPGAYQIDKIKKSIQTKKNIIQRITLKSLPKKQVKISPGPGSYDICANLYTNQRSYQNVFKPSYYHNEYQTKLQSVELFDSLQPKQETVIREKSVLKQTRKDLKQTTLKYLVQTEDLKSLNEYKEMDIKTFSKNTNPFIEKDIRVFQSYIPKSDNPGPQDYYIKSSFQRQVR